MPTNLYHMIKLPRFTQDEMNLLETQSIENMLDYYEEEMRRIAGGANPSSFLSKPLVKRFINLGILERDFGGRKCKVILSRKGRELYGLTT